jgi:hypothetical protein
MLLILIWLRHMQIPVSGTRLSCQSSRFATIWACDLIHRMGTVGSNLSQTAPQPAVPFSIIYSDHEIVVYAYGIDFDVS